MEQIYGVWGEFLFSLCGPGAAGLSRRHRASERVDVKVLLRSQSNFISAASVLGQIQKGISISDADGGGS